MLQINFDRNKSVNICVTKITSNTSKKYLLSINKGYTKNDFCVWSKKSFK
jgi:hypothetical protein